ncbi:tetratricopeptide repeat protein [Actinoplanes sp. NPDC048796]|uniref:tetratricopeptide repeat protein n=1 Tax=Actinoplanes sp. NPDC048796 TaxID=3155640 RepID=UPI0033EBCE7B
MKTAEELRDLLSQAEDMPYGAARTALAEQILRHVDAAGDPFLSFMARLIATNSFVYGGEPAKGFVTFSWCVSDFDRNPQPYHQRAQHNLLWLFKTMVNALTKFPEVPLARTYAVLDDMERRYREYGQGLGALYKYRYVVADHVGLRDEADSWYEKWQAAPRDSLSDCVGCDPTDVAGYLAARGRFAEAVEHAHPVLEGTLNCTEQPQAILEELMVPYLLTGRESDAADAHRRSYRLQRANLADMADVAGHITFCARTGNEHRGLEILQRHIDWLDKAPSPAAAMEFAAAGGHLLRRVTDLGHGDAVVRRLDRPDITAAELATELATQATDLAARFDARNGTTAQSARIAGWLAREPFGVEVPLSPTQRVTPAPPPFKVDIPDISEDLSAAELLDLAEEHAGADRDDAMVAALAEFDRRFPEPAGEEAGRRAALEGAALDWREDPEAVERTWRRAFDLLTEAGSAERAAATGGRLGVLYCLTDRPDEGFALVRAEVAHMTEHGDDRRRSSAWSRLAVAQFLAGDFAAAGDSLDRADEFAEAAGLPRHRADNEIWRVRILMAADESAADESVPAESAGGESAGGESVPAESASEGLDRRGRALAAAMRARDFYREHGPASRLAEAALMVADLSTDAEQVAEAFGEALAGGGSQVALMARAGRGRALLHLDRAAEAVPDLVEAVALCAEQGEERNGAVVRQELAIAYMRSGRPVEAAEVAEEALLLFERLELDGPADDVRFLLAGLYREIGDQHGALTIYQALIERLADNPAGRGQVGEQAGALLYDLDRDAEAAQVFQAAAEALHEAGDLIGELRLLRRRVSALHFADDAPTGLAVAEQAERLYAELPPELAAEPNAIWQRSMVAREAAGLLLARGRHAEAVPLLEGLPERLRAIGAEEDAAAIENMLEEARNPTDE